VIPFLQEVVVVLLDKRSFESALISGEITSDQDIQRRRLQLECDLGELLRRIEECQMELRKQYSEKRMNALRESLEKAKALIGAE
jgi:hypothetical protein